MKTTFKLNNGDEVKAVVNGFHGVITSCATHLFGCNRYYVDPPCVDNTIKEGRWFDEDELELISKKKVNGAAHNNGGFHSNIK